MKFFLLPFAFILMNLFSFAQYDNFDLSKYKLPDIKRHQLDFDFGLNNNYSSYDKEDDNDLSRFKMEQKLSVGYGYFLNSRKSQKNYNVNISNNLKTEKFKGYEDEPYRNGNIDLNLNLYLNNYFYLNEDQWFFHFQPVLNFSYDQENTKLTDFDKKNYSPFEFGDGIAYPIVGVESYDWSVYIKPTLNLGFGYGRIEQVGDVRHAIYIVEELANKNRMNKVLSEDEILELAIRISKLKNKRFFDSRLRQMYELQSLDTFLIESGVIDIRDAVYFTTLSDMWGYGDQNRSAGTRISFDISGGLDHNYAKDYEKKYDTYEMQFAENELNFSTKYQTLAAVVNLESVKPIGLKLQRYFSLSSTYIDIIDYRLSGYEDHAGSYLDNWLIVSASYQLQWYLNTRTSAKVNVNLTYSESNEDVYDSNYKAYNNEYLKGRLLGSIYYYFSPRLRFTFNSLIEQNWNLYKFSSYNKTFSFYSSIGMSYAIF